MRRLDARVVICVFAAIMTVFGGCRGMTPLGDGGTVRITLSFGSERSAAVVRAISASVTTVQLKLSSEEFPPILASAAYVAGGTTISVDNVKAGLWTVQLYLNDASGDTLYYGEGSVEVLSGVTASSTIAVFATGGVDVDLIEGIPAPIFSAGAAVSGGVPVTITLPAGVSGAKICYRTNGTDPTSSDARYDPPQMVTVAPTGVLKAITVMTADSSTSAVATFGLPLIIVKQGATTYLSGDPYTFDPVSPGGSGDPVYFAIKNVGASMDLHLTGVKVELSGTGADQFAYDTTELEPVIGSGQSSRFAVTFAPRVTGSYSAALKIYSDSSSGTAFSLDLDGLCDAPPTVSMLSDLLDVQGASTSGANGTYEPAGSSHAYTAYQLQGGSYYIYYEQTGSNGYSYYKYLLGTGSSAASYTADDYDAGSSRLYQKNYGTKTSPIGMSYEIEFDATSTDQWAHYSGTQGNSPYVSEVSGGIGGYPKVLRTLKAYYSYEDAENDLESGTAFQWCRSDTSSGDGTAISGATSSTYVLTGSDSGKYVSVEITPHAATGVTVGETQRTASLLVSP